MSSKFVEATKALHDCQRDKRYKSCYPCDEMVKCETRKEYVKQTYLSMNKDMDEPNNGFAF